MVSLIPTIPDKLAKATRQLNLLNSASEKEFINTLPTDSPESLTPWCRKDIFIVSCIV
ncbi:MAG: hypothetical protein L6408_03800 [Nanoarchaeota archaeon]|nr:hypothetical protein [Nanoarchaeota archaeon]